jgi:PAS domain S-box-containing protein
VTPDNSEILVDALVDLEELYELAPTGYLSFLPDSTIVKVNHTIADWLGYSKDQLVQQKKFTDLISRGNAIHYEMFFRPLINMNGSVKELNYEMVKADGSLLPTLVNATAIKDSFGKLIAVNVSVTDITDRKKYEQQLLAAKKLAEAEKKKFEVLTDLVPEIVFTADSNGTIDYVNSRYYEYLQHRRGEKLKFLSLIKNVEKEDRAATLKSWMYSVTKGDNFQVEARLCTPSGACEWHLIKAVPYKDADGVITKWFGSCSNINDQIEAVLRKDEFIKIASHELKSPLTSLKIYLQLVEQSEITPDLKPFITRAISNVNNLQYLINNLLDVTVINSGDLNLQLTVFSLTDLLQESIEQVRLSNPTHHIKFETSTLDRFYVEADRNRITEVILNLLSNAIKYSPDSNEVIVRINSHEPGFVRVEFQDFGTGIKEEDKEKIFEKYSRVETVRKKVSGLGLGLYIIQNIMALHGSKVEVSTELGKGSTFYFKMPMASSHGFSQ